MSRHRGSHRGSPVGDQPGSHRIDARATHAGGARRRTAGARRAARARPRYGRLAAAGASLAITGIALLSAFPPTDPGASGDTPPSAAPSAAPSAEPAPAAEPAGPRAEESDVGADARAGADTGAAAAASAPERTAPAAKGSPVDAIGGSVERAEASAGALGRRAVRAASRSTALPAASGSGRRVVFSESRQRVWLVESDGSVRRTYLASGSVLDNLDPGTYEVFSRSRWAVGIDDSGVMELFVRFTRGPSGAAIGFHTIPVKDGQPLQTVAELGKPRSHGCIRQKESDAWALWEFAPLGTTVVVTA